MNGEFLLDTNVVSEFRRRAMPDPNVSAWLRSVNPDSLWISVFGLGEIRKGIDRLAPGKRRVELEEWLENDLEQWFDERVLGVTKSIELRWGQLSAVALANGTPLPVVDGILVAAALEHDLVLVTRNVKDVSGLGVQVLNPWEA